MGPDLQWADLTTEERAQVREEEGRADPDFPAVDVDGDQGLGQQPSERAGLRVRRRDHSGGDTCNTTARVPSAHNAARAWLALVHLMGEESSCLCTAIQRNNNKRLLTPPAAAGCEGRGENRVFRTAAAQFSLAVLLFLHRKEATLLVQDSIRRRPHGLHALGGHEEQN